MRILTPITATLCLSVLICQASPIHAKGKDPYVFHHALVRAKGGGIYHWHCKVENVAKNLDPKNVKQVIIQAIQSSQPPNKVFRKKMLPGYGNFPINLPKGQTKTFSYCKNGIRIHPRCRSLVFKIRVFNKNRSYTDYGNAIVDLKHLHPPVKNAAGGSRRAALSLLGIKIEPKKVGRTRKLVWSAKVKNVHKRKTLVANLIAEVRGLNGNWRPHKRVVKQLAPGRMMTVSGLLKNDPLNNREFKLKAIWGRKAKENVWLRRNLAAYSSR